MTERLMSIWKHVDRIGDPDLADAIEASLVNEYLEEKCYIIPEEDWEEIQTRGYDIEMMCEDADEEHSEDPVWIETVTNSLIDQETDNWDEDNFGVLLNFWRGYYAGTEVDEISIPALNIDYELLL